MLLAEVVETSRAVAETSGRLEKIGRLAACLAQMAPDEVEVGVPFLGGELRQGRIGVGWSALRDGSLPPAASAASLTLGDVDAAFAAIGTTSGGGSSAARARVLGLLLARATAAEQQFLRGLLTGELRQGAQEGVVVEAVAKAARVPPSDVRRALMVSGSLGGVARAALACGIDGLARFRPELMRPILPMLAQTAADPAAVLERMGRAGLEYKLDGARVQIHRVGTDVRVFTRALNDVTPAVPELVEAVRALPVRQIALDGEAIVLRPDGSPAPFQVTMRRFGRRLDVERLRQELPLTPVFFDCMHLDGEDLIDVAAERRWQALDVAPPALRVVRRIATAPGEIDAFAGEALAHGHEGIMLKSPDSLYEAGRRGAAWQKLKPAHSLDLVVLAAEWGSGRRKSWLSNIHLGARDPASGGFVMLGKTFKGMTDEMLRWQTAELLAREIGREGHVVHVRPELVVEILFDGVQASPVYPGGVALRFARVKRYRSDKRAEDADTIDTVRALHAGPHASGPGAAC